MSTRALLVCAFSFITMLSACFGGSSADPPDGHDAASGGSDGGADGGGAGTPREGGAGGDANTGGASNDGGSSGTGGTTQTGGVIGTAPPVADGYKLDVLFIVGKTQSMGDIQRRLAAAAPTFLAELRRRNLTDVRIAVGTGDMGLDGRSAPFAGPQCDRSSGDIGRLPTAATCLQGAEFLHLVDDTLNVPGDPAQLLSCLLQVGTAGCVFTRLLNAFEYLWLIDRGTTFMRNFFRYEADLLVIIVSDEDDCSTSRTEEATAILRTMPGQFRRLRCATFGHMCDLMRLEAVEQSFPLSSCRESPGTSELVSIRDSFLPRLEEIRQRKREERVYLHITAEPRVMIAALSGWPSETDLPTARYAFEYVPTVTGEPLLDLAPVCGQGEGAARPALRLRALANRMPPGDGLYLSVCGDDLSPALVQAAGLP